MALMTHLMSTVASNPSSNSMGQIQAITQGLTLHIKAALMKRKRTTTCTCRVLFLKLISSRRRRRIRTLAVITATRSATTQLVCFNKDPLRARSTRTKTGSYLECPQVGDQLKSKTMCRLAPSSTSTVWSASTATTSTSRTLSLRVEWISMDEEN